MHYSRILYIMYRYSYDILYFSLQWPNVFLTQTSLPNIFLNMIFYLWILFYRLFILMCNIFIYFLRFLCVILYILIDQVWRNDTHNSYDNQYKLTIIYILKYVLVMLLKYYFMWLCVLKIRTHVPLCHSSVMIFLWLFHYNRYNGVKNVY